MCTAILEGPCRPRLQPLSMSPAAYLCGNRYSHRLLAASEQDGKLLPSSCHKNQKSPRPEQDVNPNSHTCLT